MLGAKVPFVIGVAGGTSSGKSTVCARIIERLEVAHKRRVVSISQDSFYRDLTKEESERAARGEFNFDHPDAIDHNLMLHVLKELMSGETVHIPNYDFCTNSRTENFTTIEPADIIFVEGILIFYHHELRGMFDMKLFIDADSDDRLARRIRRDLHERGRTLKQVLNQYLNSVKPAFEEFCLPTKKYADVIIPHGAENEIAIDLILHHINEILRSPSSSLSSISDDGRRGNVEAAEKVYRMSKRDIVVQSC